MVDYSKWKDIEVSDDEDETHPNIDTPSLFRWRHEARVTRMDESRKEKEDYERQLVDFVKRQKELEERKAAGEDVKELEKKIAEERIVFKDREEELAKKEKMTPWNVDTIGTDGFSKTVINKKEKASDKDMTEEEKAERFRKFSDENDKKVKEFGMLRKYDDSRRLLLENPQLACEDTANYLVYWCIDLAMEEKFQLMDHVSHQCISIQFLLELAKQLDMDPRSCISPFFTKIAHVDHTDYKQAFNSELELFRGRIRKRAEEKLNEALEKERLERMGPGGLDPFEVLESLPESLQKCFEDQDIPMLQKAISELPEEEATYHMKRCVDSGLWVPNAKDKLKKEEAAAAAAAANAPAAEEEEDKTEVKEDKTEVKEDKSEVKT